MRDAFKKIQVYNYHTGNKQTKAEKNMDSQMIQKIKDQNNLLNNFRLLSTKKKKKRHFIANRKNPGIVNRKNPGIVNKREKINS